MEIINSVFNYKCLFVSYGKGDLEEEKVGRGGMVVGGDIFWVLIKKI